MPTLRSVARPLLAAAFVAGGVNAIKNPMAPAPRAKPVTDRVGSLARRVAPGLPMPDETATWVRINATAQIVGAMMLATGRLPRVAAVGLLASLGPTTLAGHPFWRERDPQARSAQRIQFFKNMSMAGGLLYAATDSGRPPRRSHDEDAA